MRLSIDQDMIEIFISEGLPGASGNREACPNTSREQGNTKNYFKGTVEHKIKF